ncbi:MAG: hypothetical protein ACOX87_11850 [Chloroflexota bacterium]|jgi:hypothetical protein
MLSEAQVEFLKIQWRLGKIASEQIDQLVSLGRLTQEQADYITS